MGTKGKMIVDGTELKIHFKDKPKDVTYNKGWNIRHINEFPSGVDYYLRGEEYSDQLDHFIQAVSGTAKNDINTFETAWKTDKIIDQIRSFKISA
jgi:predicted dehydrogenase